MKKEQIQQQYCVLEYWNKEQTIALVQDKITNILLVQKEEFKEKLGIYQELQKVKNEHLSAIWAVHECEDCILVYMEYIPGETLENRLKRELCTKEEAISYAMGILQGLEVLHKKKIIHKDIQPQNILITSKGEAKIIDFGISRIYTPEKIRDTRLVGTVGYAPPEQYGLEQSDSTTDIYAMGVLLNEMLTGKFPEEYLYIEDKRISHIIRKCCKLDKRKRYATAEELKEALCGSDFNFYGKQLLAQIPGFRRDESHRWAIFLLGYPFLGVWCNEMIKGTMGIRMELWKKIPWSIVALFLSCVVPFVLLSNLGHIQQRMYRFRKVGKGKRYLTAFGLTYLSIMLFGIMLMLYYVK